MERSFLTICSFLNHFCWSVNYMSRVSKFNNFFVICSEIKARRIIEGFQYCFLWKVQFQLSSTFSSFFSTGLLIAQITFLVPICWSVNCISWVFDFRNLQKLNLYLRAFSTAIYQKFDLYYLCLFKLFFGLQTVQFWSVNYITYSRPS